MFEFNYLIFLALLMFFCGFYVFCFKLKNFLLMLLSLEFMMTSLFFLMFLYFLSSSDDSFILLYFLIMSVSESVLGLSLLVCLVRVEGNDLFKILNMLKLC